jgi:NAD(P)H-hydrate epimerase
VDVPSGLDCDTGAVDPATLKADLTVTFGAPKHGQFRFPGAAVLGELVVADIGLDPALSADISAHVLTLQKVCARLPDRPMDAHKGTFGKAMIVAGSINYTGAPYLAATAAARVGTGLVTLAPPQAVHPIVASKLCEATFLVLPHRTGVLVPDAVKVLASHLQSYTALLLGPGLGQEKETVSFVHQLLGLEKSSQVRQIGFQRSSTPQRPLALPPLVLDADALNALAGVPDWWLQIPENCILTPHPGEMARLTGKTTADINADRLSIARQYAVLWSQVVVLKGAFTVIATPDQQTTLVPFANPGLATAGTGDVLAGCIAGMLAQGLDPADAACCGAFVHALAGHMVAEDTGTTGMLAGDLLPHLPLAIRRICESHTP